MYMIVWAVGLFIIYKVLDRLIRKPKVGKYSEKYVFVTGCDSGFGKIAAVKLDALGCHVFAGLLTEEGEKSLRNTCSSRLQTVKLDLMDSESIRQAFEFVKSKLPPGKGLWGLVNNAGVGGKRGRMEWLNINDYKFVMSVNFFGLVEMTTTFLPLIKKAKGRVVNTSSMGGRIALTDAAPYTSSKYAVEAFSDSLRRSLRVFGCKVMLIEPGGFKTCINNAEAINRSVSDAWNGSPKEAQEEFGQEYFRDMLEAIHNIKVDDNPGEVADAYLEALFSSFPRARYVVGTQGRRALLIPPLPEWVGDLLWEKLRKDAQILPAAIKKKYQ